MDLYFFIILFNDYLLRFRFSADFLGKENPQEVESTQIETWVPQVPQNPLIYLEPMEFNKIHLY